MSTHSVRCSINGRPTTLQVEPRQSLADAIRQLGLTGTHLGCEHGACGACTILLDGEAVRGCLLLAVQVEGLGVTTIEGVSPPEGLNQIQQAMHRHHALQCGFCTPGMVLALTALFATTPSPAEAEIREAISGNLCRCTGYQPIIAAALELARANREPQPT
jgi:aerobic-type carbon monoxide dehydrogenase small subunit (CoxS/CutS family)